MAIAEARVGVVPRVAEAMPKPVKNKLEFIPIEFPKEDIEKLAQLPYKNSLYLQGADRSQMSNSQTAILGVVDIQALVLTMLGQEHLLDGKFPTYEDVVKPRLIRKKQIKILVERYKFSRVRQKFMESTTKPVGISPEQARIQANADTLAKTLIDFDQESLVRSIDGQIDSNIDQIDWSQMRSTGKGELF